MAIITPFEFFTALYPDPVGPGQLMLRSTIRRSGKTHTDWCFTLQQAARLAEHYRRTRRVRFGVALHDRGIALSQARRRFKRATPARVCGAESSVTALTALWARIDARNAGPRDAGPQPTDRAAALADFEALPRPPSILVWDGAGFDAYWRLTEPWVLATAEDRRQAKLLLAKVQWALNRAGGAGGPQPSPGRSPDLAGLARVPGTFRHRRRRRRRSGVLVTVEQFPLLGDDRTPRSDFEALEAPPEGRGPASGSHLLPWEVPAAAPPPAAASPADFRPVWRGCSWLRHCYDDQASLREREWTAALSIVGRSAAGAADGPRLARSFSDRHPGYAPHLLDQQLHQVLGRKSGPARCDHVARDLGAWDRHCQACPHRGEIDSPIDLGRPKVLHPPPTQSVLQALMVPSQPQSSSTERRPRSVEGSIPEETVSTAVASVEHRAQMHSAGAARDRSSTAIAGELEVSPRALQAAVQVELVIRAGLPGAGTPAAGVPAAGVPATEAPGDLPARAAGELLRAALAELGPAGEPGPAVEVPGSFVDGLEELLAELGGRATARRMAAALAAEENRERFGALRAALRQLCPGSESATPTARQLGYALRAHHRRTDGGRTIVQTRKNVHGVTWTLRKTRAS